MAHRRPALGGRTLPLARAAWMIVALTTVGIFIAGVPPYFAQLAAACTRSAELCAETGLLTAPEMRELRSLGLSAGFYAGYMISLGVASAMVWWVVGAVIFWRRSADRMALLASLALVTFGALSSGAMQEAARAYPAWAPVAQLLTVIGFTSIIVFLYTFPDGRFLPRWMVLPALVWIANDAVSVIFPEAYRLRWVGTIGFLAFLIPAVCAVGSQVYRYRRVSGPEQRQQTKWVIFGIVVGFGGYLALVVIQGVFFGFEGLGPLGGMVFQTLVTALFLVIPLSIGFAVLRSRLWNIDVVINRALVYGALTVSLALVYFGVVVGLQYVFRAVTGGESQLAVVASTLAIAALFNPLRRRVQAVVDRRFYRKKYDARKTLQTFLTRLRNETDLDGLNDELVSVVRETLQPEHASLWLRSPRAGSREV